MMTQKNEKSLVRRIAETGIAVTAGIAAAVSTASADTHSKFESQLSAAEERAIEREADGMLTFGEFREAYEDRVAGVFSNVPGDVTQEHAARLKTLREELNMQLGNFVVAAINQDYHLRDVSDGQTTLAQGYASINLMDEVTSHKGTRVLIKPGAGHHVSWNYGGIPGTKDQVLPGTLGDLAVATGYKGNNEFPISFIDSMYRAGDKVVKTDNNIDFENNMKRIDKVGVEFLYGDNPIVAGYDRHDLNDGFMPEFYNQQMPVNFQVVSKNKNLQKFVTPVFDPREVKLDDRMETAKVKYDTVREAYQK